MSDRLHHTHSTSRGDPTTTTTQSSTAGTARKIAAWAYYGLFGFWLRVIIEVTLIACGLGLLAAFPLAVLQRSGAIPIGLVHIGPWIDQQSNGFYLAAGLVSAFGAFLLYLAFGPARRWLPRRPGA